MSHVQLYYEYVRTRVVLLLIVSSRESDTKEAHPRAVVVFEIWRVIVDTPIQRPTASCVLPYQVWPKARYSSLTHHHSLQTAHRPTARHQHSLSLTAKRHGCHGHARGQWYKPWMVCNGFDILRTACVRVAPRRGIRFECNLRILAAMTERRPRHNDRCTTLT